MHVCRWPRDDDTVDDVVTMMGQCSRSPHLYTESNKRSMGIIGSGGKGGDSFRWGGGVWGVWNAH